MILKVEYASECLGTYEIYGFQALDHRDSGYEIWTGTQEFTFLVSLFIGYNNC